MKISVKVKTGARETMVEKTDERHFAVAIKARPEKGKANREVIAALADYFAIAKSNVGILSGHSSRNKIFNIRK